MFIIALRKRKDHFFLLAINLRSFSPSRLYWPGPGTLDSSRSGDLWLLPILGKKKNVREAFIFLDIRYCVISRSGISVTDVKVTSLATSDADLLVLLFVNRLWRIISWSRIPRLKYFLFAVGSGNRKSWCVLKYTKLAGCKAISVRFGMRPLRFWDSYTLLFVLV